MRTDAVILKLPPPIWTLAYLLIAAGVSFLTGWRGAGLPLVPVAVALVVLGAALTVAAAVLFRKVGTELNPTSAVNRVLVTTGPFRFTRNPMYLGLVTVALGVALWVGAYAMLLAPLATFATVNFVHVPYEEAKMRRQFGEAFETYRRTVRRWI